LKNYRCEVYGLDNDEKALKIAAKSARALRFGNRYGHYITILMDEREGLATRLMLLGLKLAHSI
jgi:hypothetical protein